MHQSFNKNLVFSCVRFIAIILLFTLFFDSPVFAQQSKGNARVNINDNTRIDRTPVDSTPFPIPAITIHVDPSRERGQIGTGLQILILLTILSENLNLDPFELHCFFRSDLFSISRLYSLTS